MMYCKLGEPPVAGRWCPRREEGQVLVMMAVFLTVLCGFAGLVVDLGRVYVAQRQLQQAVDAAALAAAQDLPMTATANGDVTLYSAFAGNKNARPGMSAASPVATYKCLSSTGIRCQSGSGQCSCNAIQVRETASVDTTFLGLLGLSRFTSISSSSTASMHGGTPHDLDVAVVLDSTTSMNESCGNDVAGITHGDATKLDCAKEGVRALLSSLDPCSEALTSCGNVISGNVAQALDEVALFEFPGLVNPSAYTHDSTSTSSNLNLNFGCPGNLTTNPSWYRSWVSPLGTNEVERISISATGGDFTIGYGGHTSGNIKWNAAAATVQSALTGSPISLGTGNVSVSASLASKSSVYTITFQGSLGYRGINPPLTAASSKSLPLSGANKTITVTTPTDGTSYFPNWYLVGPSSGSTTNSDFAYSGSNLSYQIVPLSSDYRSSDSAATLAAGSKLVQAASWSSCSGGNWPGNPYYGLSGHEQAGAGTYIAGAINAAQTTLANDSARRATPIMIVLSDGDADLQPSGSSNPCHEAVAAAQAAATAGTAVYSIAYDASTSSATCANDSGSYGSLTGFTTMQQIASDANKFYCLDPPHGQTCNSAAASSLAEIFADIGIDVTNTRLVSDDTH